MAVRSKTIGRLGTILTFFCLTFLLLSFASDRWVQSSGRDNTGFENLGLWSVCFKDYYPPVSALVNRKYDGCWWVLNKELDDLRNFLIPSWLEATQILLTLCLVIVLIVCVILIINLINCFPYSPHRHAIKRYMALSSSLLLLLTAVLLTVAVLVFGVNSSNTGKGWLQNNDENSLSWSFGMCILADFLAILAGMVLLFQFYRHRSEKGDATEPKVFLTNEPPPGTNYRNAPNSYRDRPVAESNNPRDPAYVQRYAKSDESKASLITGPPTEMFAVSGAGEVYVNNMAANDENNRGQHLQQRPPPTRRPVDQQMAPSQRNHNNAAQPPAFNGPRGSGPRQLGRQGYPLRLQEPSFAKPQGGGDGSQDGSVSDRNGRSNSRHPSLPEYVPKKKRHESPTEDDSAEDNASVASNARKGKSRKKRGTKDDDVDSERGEGSKRKSRSKSKSGDKENTRDRSRSNSRSRRKTKTDTDTEPDNTPSQKRRSKKKRQGKSKAESSEDEGSVNRQRSRRRKNSKGRSRSMSKDRMTSDSQVDSDTGSTRSRSRKKRDKEKEFSRMDAKRRSASEDNLSMRSGRSGKRRSRSKNKYDGNASEDFSGSEGSLRSRRSRRKGGRQSDGESKSRLRDLSDTESIKSRSKKPKGTYSSYYEY